MNLECDQCGTPTTPVSSIPSRRTIWDRLMGRTQATLDDGDFVNVTVREGRIAEVLCDNCYAQKHGEGRPIQAIQSYEDLQALRALDRAIHFRLDDPD